MQRFVNDPDYIVEDMVKGYVKAHKDLIKRSEANDRVVQYVNAPVEGKVGLVTGGGSGHEPAFLGYVGKNMMDAVAVGEIFSSPSAQAFYDAFMSVDSGQGVACLFGNYAGDNMNVKMAIRKAKKQGVTLKYVIDTNLPIINKLNPNNLITDGFYSLYYYDTLNRYWNNLLGLIIFVILCLSISFISLRREKYDSI